jgi:hypothetical protein
MIKRKVTIVLQSFTSDELNKLQSFLKSPYFNRNENLLFLLQYIINAIEKKWTKDPKKFNDDIALKKAFKGILQPANTINQSCSNLLRLTESFIYHEGLGYLSHEEFKKDSSIRKDIELNKFYINRCKTNDEMIRIVQNDFDKGELYFENVFNDFDFRNSDYFYYRFLLSYKRTTFLNSQSNSKGIEIGNTLNNFIIYFILTSLRLMCLSITRNILFNENHVFYFYNNVIELAQKEPYSNIYAVKLWSNTLHLYENPTVENYYKVKSLVNEENAKELQSEEIYTILTILNNQCITIISDKDLYNEMFELCELMVKNNVMIAQGFIPEMKIRNCITIALHLGKTKWAEQFLEKFKDSIHSQFKDDVYYFLKAKIAFAQKKFNITYDLINEKIKDFPNILIKIEVIYVLPILIAFEEKDEMIDTFLDRFNSFLSYNQENLNERHKNGYLVFKNKLKQIKHYSTAINLSSSEKNDVLNLKKEITGIHNQEIAEKDWLLVKMEELILKFKIKEIIN